MLPQSPVIALVWTLLALASVGASAISLSLALFRVLTSKE